jgi:hypothetical protein
VVRRAASYSDFYHVVKAQLSKDDERREKKRGSARKDRSWEALTLGGAVSKPETTTGESEIALLDGFDDYLLEASEQEYTCVVVNWFTHKHCQSVSLTLEQHVS